MRSIVILAGLLVCWACLPAFAGTTTTVTVKTYAVSGDTGERLVGSMDRNGPRQGLLARAIAQTRYSVDWTLRWRMTGTACRLVAADARLAIDYRYPALAHPVAPALKRRWSAFMAGVRRHEETHGRLARAMVAEAGRAAARVAFRDDPSCRRAKAEVERRVKTVYADYEAKQLRFDEVEHRLGGKVDRLLAALIGHR